MSVVKSSIENLHNAIVKLESAVEVMEEKMVGAQRDMFSSAPSNENDSSSDIATMDKTMIAQRLDNAIDKVERLLKDGSNG